MGAFEEKYTNNFFQELSMFTKPLQQRVPLENNNAENVLTVAQPVMSVQTTVKIFSIEKIEWKRSCKKSRNQKLECNL
jgi:hypothetical protein